MTSSPQDRELVATYAKDGCESAFRALVARHVGLVHATALRQVGDPGLAEEVTQNVFMTLARKAPRLTGLETLAGWLHRTALLEAKARIRAELRRRRREDTAARLASEPLPSPGHDEGFAALTPLLDEALLQLRDTDRLALVLRFLEDRSLRDVGLVLGVDEDAARKRVARALDRVTEFFRHRGFSLPAGVGAAAIFSQATQAAPAAVALGAAQAGLAVGGGATGFNLLLLHLMSLTKTQTAVVCAVLAAAPIAYQHRAIAEAEQVHARVVTDLSLTDADLAAQQDRLARNQDELRRVQLAALNAESRLASLEQQRAELAALEPYRWDDQSPVVRVPKEFVKQLFVSYGVQDRRGRLSLEIKAALQLTETESAQVEAATGRFLAQYHAAQAAAMKRVEPEPTDIGQRKPEDVRVFEVPGIPETVAELRGELFAAWTTALAEERAEILKRAVEGWLPPETFHGISSETTVFNVDHRQRFFRDFQHVPFPAGKKLTIGWGWSRGDGNALWLNLPVDQIPPHFREHLQDWILEAQNASPTTAQPSP